MGLEQQIMAEMKEDMKAKDEASLRGLRAIKAEIIKAKTEPGAAGEISEGQEIALLQKMVKQRRESIALYEQGGRPELAEAEAAEVAVIERFLPSMMDEAETAAAIDAIAGEIGATSVKDMGRVMAELKSRHAGRLDMSKASGLVKARLAG